MQRVCSKHEIVHVTVGGAPHRIVFTEERPGVFVADVEDTVADYLLYKVGVVGGYWSDAIATEPQPTESPFPATDTLSEADAPGDVEPAGEPALSSDGEDESKAKPRKRKS